MPLDTRYWVPSLSQPPSETGVWRVTSYKCPWPPRWGQRRGAGLAQSPRRLRWLPQPRLGGVCIVPAASLTCPHAGPRSTTRLPPAHVAEAASWGARPATDGAGI